MALVLVLLLVVALVLVVMLAAVVEFVPSKEDAALQIGQTCPMTHIWPNTRPQKVS